MYSKFLYNLYTKESLPELERIFDRYISGKRIDDLFSFTFDKTWVNYIPKMEKISRQSELEYKHTELYFLSGGYFPWYKDFIKEFNEYFKYVDIEIVKEKEINVIYEEYPTWSTGYTRKNIIYPADSLKANKSRSTYFSRPYYSKQIKIPVAILKFKFGDKYTEYAKTYLRSFLLLLVREISCFSNIIRIEDNVREGSILKKMLLNDTINGRRLCNLSLTMDDLSLFNDLELVNKLVSPEYIRKRTGKYTINHAIISLLKRGKDGNNIYHYKVKIEGNGYNRNYVRYNYKSKIKLPPNKDKDVEPFIFGLGTKIGKTFKKKKEAEELIELLKLMLDCDENKFKIVEVLF